MDWLRFARAARSVFAGRRGAKERGGMRGEWKIEVFGPDGQLKGVRSFKNLIVNAGFESAKNRLFDPATTEPFFGWIAIGTDATPAAAGQTALLAEVARGAVTYTDAGTAVCTIERTFAAGVGTGTIVEVGAFNANAAGDMFNRATFAAIAKGAGDTLKATCTITLSNA